MTEALITLKNNMADILIYTLLISATPLIISFLSGIIVKLFYMLLTPILGRNAAYLVIERLTFVGTIFHELSHALFAFITGAKVTRIHLLELWNGNTFGSVQYTPRGNFITKQIQSYLAAAAPAYLGTGFLYFLYKYVYVYVNTPLKMAVFVYVFISVLLHMTLSGKDLESILKGFIVFFLIVFMVMCALSLTGKLKGTYEVISHIKKMLGTIYQ